MLVFMAIVVLFAAGAWWRWGRRSSPVPVPAAAHLVVQWRGSYRGTMALPAQLRWCPVTRVGTLEAISGDSGVAVALYERDSLAAGSYPVTAPDQATSAARPAATAAIRWMRLEKDTALAGFRSQSGTVRLRLANGRASGDINVRMLASAGRDTLVLQGWFRDLPVLATAAGCT